jgi:cysteinyl-tRNA synthetase
MTLEHLGARFDIHSGGKDLVFPHHSNEIAQSVAALSDRLDPRDYARHWMHNGFVEIDQEKMSKSLGNFFTVKDVLQRHDGEALRLLLLGTHYRNPINFSDGLLGDAERRLAYLYETLEKADRIAEGATPDDAPTPWAEAARAALDDDFNTAAVLGILAEAFTSANADADRKGKRTPAERAALARFARDARSVGGELGILQRAPVQALLALRGKAVVRRGIDPALVESRIAERAQARRAKDFARSDAVRDELLALGVTIQDGPSGTTWKVE